MVFLNKFLANFFEKITMAQTDITNGYCEGLGKC